MRKIIFMAVLTAAFCSLALAEENQLKKLWDIPTAEVKAEKAKSYTSGKVRVEEIYYSSRPYKGRPVKIFGYFCYPAKRTGKIPALLLSHGGGGTASLPRAEEWARRGYAVLAIDLPGKGENRRRSRSTGPDMTVKNLLRTQPELSYNYLVHAVAAARNGITYLTQRKEIDPQRIGMIGLSWGGVLTLLTNGQDKRLKAAVNVFGAGHIPEGCTWEDWFSSMSATDEALWDNNLDPKNFLATQHAPILFITGTNDHCYYLTTFQKSYLEAAGPKAFYLIPNLRHRFFSSAQVPALAWLDQHLKWGGSFPVITLLSPTQEGEKIILPVSVEVSGKVKSVRLYYARGGPSQWTQKKWLEVKPYAKDRKYYFVLPVKLLRPEIIFYVSVKDSHNGAASTLAQSLFALKREDGTGTFAYSAPLTRTYQHDKPIRLLDGTDISGALLSYSKKNQAYSLISPSHPEPRPLRNDRTHF